MEHRRRGTESVNDNRAVCLNRDRDCTRPDLDGLAPYYNQVAPEFSDVTL